MPSFLTKKRLAAAGVVVVVIGGAVAAASARSESSPSYRTTKASLENVDQELHTVGSVEPVSQASVSFPVAGTVAGVDVKVGQEVVVGSRLAFLDVEDLKVTLHEKQASLDQANLVLQMALDGEDVSGLASSGSGPGNGTFGRPAVGDADAELKAAQQAVLDAQKAVDEATATADQAYDNAVAVCSESTVQAAVEDGSTTTTTAADNSQACLDALQAVLDAQAAVTAAQAQLTDAVNHLNDLLDEMANNPSTPTTTTPVSPSVPSGGNGSNGNGSTSGSFPSGSTGSSGSSGTPSGSGGTGTGTTSSSPSAEDLVSYQKAVDAAEDEVAVAQQAIDQATIVSPIDGRIASVNLKVGESVEASSSTANIVVVGEGGYEITTSVSVKDLPDVKVGQKAMVKPDGADAAVEGEVVRIGVAADTSGSSASYTVTIGLTGDTSAMGNGSTASVVIVTSSAEKALAVPTSAVTVDGDRSTVSVLADGKAKTTTVKTGAVGATWTEITDGLEEGDVVILADLDEPLPGSATDTSANSGQGQRGTFTFPGGGQAGGFPGGGRPPGN